MSATQGTTHRKRASGKAGVTREQKSGGRATIVRESMPVGQSEASREKIAARQAAVAAAAYLSQIVGPGLNPVVEEVELDDTDRYWLITLGYQAPGAFPFAGSKEYKVFKVDSYTGEVVSMKIREIKV
jgi:hypothetical protein